MTSKRELRLVDPGYVDQVSVDFRRLEEVGKRPSLIDYLASVWRYRHFISFDASSRAQSKTSGDRLGFLWLILNPLVTGIAFFLVFGLLLNTGARIPNFVAYLIIGVFLFQYSTRSITSIASVLRGNSSVIHSFRFPRITLPIAICLRELISSVPAILTMLVLIIVLPPTESITLLWLLLIPLILIQTIFNLGVGLIFARIVARFADFTHVIGYGMRILMYTSAVFFSYTRYIDHPVILQIMYANPLFNVLDLARNFLIYENPGSWHSWNLLMLWAFGALLVGVIVFWQGEETYGRPE